MGFAQHFGVLCRSGSRNWLNHLPTRVNGRASEWGSMPLSWYIARRRSVNLKGPARIPVGAAVRSSGAMVHSVQSPYHPTLLYTSDKWVFVSFRDSTQAKIPVVKMGPIHLVSISAWLSSWNNNLERKFVINRMECKAWFLLGFTVWLGLYCKFSSFYMGSHMPDLILFKSHSKTNPMRFLRHIRRCSWRRVTWCINNMSCCMITYWTMIGEWRLCPIKKDRYCLKEGGGSQPGEW